MNAQSRCETVAIRGVRYNVRHWGAESAPVVFFLHGWMDCSPTFQFVVEALRQAWHVVAPDWRGYGESEYLNRPYWFPDYYADLDALLAHYSPDQPARLVGHSMGANIAATYAGVRPQRVSQLVKMDFLGLNDSLPADTPARLGMWLEQAQSHPRLSSYADVETLASRLRFANPRLTPERASFLARHCSRPSANGRVQLASDPWHKGPSPLPYRVEDSMACWSRIEAPVLLLIADHGFVQQRFGLDSAEYFRRVNSFPTAQVALVTDSGHNLQHDQPEQVAAALERFLQRH